MRPRCGSVPRREQSRFIFMQLQAVLAEAFSKDLVEPLSLAVELEDKAHIVNEPDLGRLSF